MDIKRVRADNRRLSPKTDSTSMNNVPHVLIVEDDPDMSRVLTHLFRRRGYQAVSTRDVHAALATATRSAPDAVVLDLRLAADSGLSLIRPMRAINPAMKILVLTGYASIRTAVDAIKLGADHYLAKPADVGAILAALGLGHPAGSDGARGDGPKARSLEHLKWKHIMRVLADHGGNISATARALRMHRRTLQRQLTAKTDASSQAMLATLRQRAARRRRRSLADGQRH